MEYRRLGRTGLDVGVIGLGTEYLNKRPRETVIAVAREAVERGVNYFDLVFSFPEYLDNLAVAFEGCRHHILLTGHLGSTSKDGQYQKSRNVKVSGASFLDVLSRLGTDYVDVLFLHNFNTVKDYDKVMQPNGQMDLACRLRGEGRARFIGISAHSIEVAMKAVESGQIDVLMLPVNLAANAVQGKRDLLLACATHGVGVVAMKPFAGGKLLSSERTVRVAAYQMGGTALKLKKATPITPVQCLSYVLAQVGVCTTIPGCQDVEQLSAALAYVDAADEERDFSALLTEFQQYAEGECVYCNHCLPCPAVIDIGQVNRLVDAAQSGVSGELQAAYEGLLARGSDCTECEACVERCPFGVDVVAKIARVVELFEEAAG